jgi:D-alanyl-D-alanine carboxypeptidase
VWVVTRLLNQQLETLAQALYDTGIREVDGLYMDDFAFAHPRWRSGWMWDDPDFLIGALFLDGLAYQNHISIYLLKVYLLLALEKIHLKLLPKGAL